MTVPPELLTLVGGFAGGLAGGFAGGLVAGSTRVGGIIREALIRHEDSCRLVTRINTPVPERIRE